MITILLLQIALSQRFFPFDISLTRLYKIVTIVLTKRLRCRCDKAGLRDFQCDDELFSLLNLLRQSREISIDPDGMDSTGEYTVHIL